MASRPAERLSGSLATARGRVEPYARAAESWPGRLIERLFEIEFVDRSVALAAKAFVAFFPLLLAVTAFSPEDVRLSIATSLRDRLGMSGPEFESARAAFTNPDALRAATGILGLVLLFFYATTFTTALQRLYLAAWRRPRGGGVRNQGRGLMWLVGIIVLFAIGGTVRRFVEGPVGDASTAVFAVAGSTLGWWWTAYTMLRGEVRWRPLLPGALATALSVTAYTVSAEFWMPRQMESNQSQFGFFGVTLSLVTWFVGVMTCVVVGTAVSPVLAEATGRWGRLACGDESALRPGVPASYPPPMQRPTFLTALGGGRAAQRPAAPENPEAPSEPAAPENPEQPADRSG